MKRVSVIIPFFNRSHTIERCLISVQRQTLSDFECLIIDDGSD
ncbi:MAG: glycosyltransferase family 2 protein, partial [Flavobacteriales bacterium]